MGMKAYPAELRIRIVRAVEGGMAQTEAARLFAVSTRTIRRYLTAHRAGGDLTPGQSPGRPPRIGRDQAAAVQAQVAHHPDATLAEHCDIWEREQGSRVSVATMSRTIRGRAITVKKKFSSRPSAMRSCAPPGGTRCRTSTRRTWFLSTRAGRTSA